MDALTKRVAFIREQAVSSGALAQLPQEAAALESMPIICVDKLEIGTGILKEPGCGSGDMVCVSSGVHRTKVYVPRASVDYDEEYYARFAFRDLMCLACGKRQSVTLSLSDGERVRIPHPVSAKRGPKTKKPENRAEGKQDLISRSAAAIATDFHEPKG